MLKEGEIPTIRIDNLVYEAVPHFVTVRVPIQGVRLLPKTPDLKESCPMSRQRSMEAIQASEFVTIGELARLTATRYSTLKFYTEEGMLPFEQAEENLTRRYRREETVERISRIKQLRSEGMSIPEIKAMLTME
ncbi:hypothetical protein HMSSN139_15470 [Paenibacillus sp. HMSSN-139]|nr:hypothetical protein HMSSN139_15470 [Paenibacillus sp. HMSSN-139]